MITFLKYIDSSALKHVKSQHDLILSVRNNPLQKKYLAAIGRRFHLTIAQLAKMAGVALRTYQRQKPNTVLSAYASESVLKMAEIYQNGMKAFDGDEGSFLKWLNAPIPALNNDKPIDLMTTIMGADLVNKELLRIEHGLFA